MNYPVTSTPTVLIDHEAMHNLHSRCSMAGARVALIGFNEYAKHLINLCGENIVCVYDPEDWKIGISFRGKAVVSRATTKRN
jgi:hypothetical protein